MSDAERRFWAKVDKSGDCWLWTGACNSSRGYGLVTIARKTYYAHRIAYEWLVGPIPAGRQLDHRPSCPRHCVNPQHLRPVTNKQNQENVTVRRDSKSGVRGVYWVPDCGKYRAQVRHNRKLLNVGYYLTLEEAKAAVIAKRNELFTHNDLDRRS